MNNQAAFKPEQYGLITLLTRVAEGFVFVSTNHEAADLDQVLGDFSSRHRPWSLGSLVSSRRREFEVGCNWKSFMEVFNEYYHLPSIHPHSISKLYHDPQPGDSVTGHYASQFGQTQGTGALLQDAQSASFPAIPNLEKPECNGVRYTWVFPNLSFAAGADAVWVYETFPINARRTLVAMTTLFPQSTLEMPDFAQRVAAYYKRFDQAIEEDIPALENQQAGLNSCLALSGRFCELLEDNVAQFAFWYGAKLTKE